MARRTAKDYDAVIASPFGRLGIRLSENRLCDLDFLTSVVPLKAPRSVAARDVCTELSAYVRDGRHRVRLPLTLVGTKFQQRVWRALQRIPNGAVVSYGTLAARLSSSPRAIGGACRANPVPIVVPCHRVVGRHDIGGFNGQRRGAAVARKRRLIAHESVG